MTTLATSKAIIFKMAKTLRTLKSFQSSMVGASFSLSHVRNFHGTIRLEKGRRTGSAALEPDPRKFSKKQKRRKLDAIEKKKGIIDHRKQSIKMKHFEKQMESPSFKDLADDMDESMLSSLRSLMLPEGLTDDEQHPTDQMNKASIKVDSKNILNTLREFSSRPFQYQGGNQIQISDARVTAQSTILSLHYFVNRGNLNEAEELSELMFKYGFPLDVKAYTALMSAAIKAKKFNDVQKYFDLMISRNIEPDLIAWNTLIQSKSIMGKPDEALQTIQQLKKIGIDLTNSCSMYVPILKAFVISKRYEDANKLWLDLHCEGIELNKEIFNIMLKLCALTNQCEKAFFYYDEMKTLEISPDTYTFTALFRAAAEAPHWVNGYQNTIFDAMCSMEGAEILPTTEIYNSIIYGFARAADAGSAEYYFWEMRKKGLQPTTTTYNSLLTAYARYVLYVSMYVSFAWFYYII